MPLHRNTSHRLTQLLRAVAAVTDLDPGIDQLRQRFNDFESGAGRTRIVDLLAAAVAAGDTDQPLLMAAAVAEHTATPQVAAEVITEVRQRLHRRIRDLAADTGTATYQAVAQKFTAAADAFLAAATAVDVEAPAELVVDWPDKHRKLWSQAPGLAAELDRLAAALHAAAVLAGITADTPDAEISVAIDATGIEPATIRDAWNIREAEAKAARTATGPFTGKPAPTRTRCGRWSSLLTAGASIRAYQPDVAPAV